MKDTQHNWTPRPPHSVTHSVMPSITSQSGPNNIILDKERKEELYEERRLQLLLGYQTNVFCAVFICLNSLFFLSECGLYKKQ